MILPKYSMGVGDRFGRQGPAQLQAMELAGADGVDVAPVWNKSHREHTIIRSSPADVRVEADQAVREMGWTGGYFVDADHVGLDNVDAFIVASDFFTLDVAAFIGSPGDADDVRAFVDRCGQYVGCLQLSGLDQPLEVLPEQVASAAGKYLPSVREAGKIYKHIAAARGEDNFVTEVSMDETDRPQTPVEMFFILAAIADEGIPLQTIAPRFSGRFNKGVDYVGDVGQFEKEFNQDLAVIAFAVKEFGLPENLKLSVHSGSDKFSLYGPIRKAIRTHDAGLHIKTAGTTWLEELIGLASAGGEGLDIAREIYAQARSRLDELCRPYAEVLDIDPQQLPSCDEVARWTSRQYADALRHEPSCPQYNPHFRQLLHVAYKIAAEMPQRYLQALDDFRDVIASGVTDNIYRRHLKRIFIDD